MHIEFDSIIYSLQRFGGASVYWNNIVSRIKAERFVQVTESMACKGMRGIPVHSRANIFHSSHFRVTYLSQAKTVTTVHDLTYELGMLGWGLKARINILERKRSYFDADAIICISENTKSDLLKIYPGLKNRCPIYVVYHGFTLPDFHNLELPLGLEGGRYLLYVGGRKNYKNFELALRGFFESRMWRDGYKLVCTGSDFTSHELETFRHMGVEKDVVNVGMVNEATLFLLYKHAHCLLYTSRYEGFGLPLIEAMSVGCPVIAAGVSCLPEIVGSAGVLVDPDSPDEVARAIHDLGNKSVRDLLISSGLVRSSKFSWDTSASKHLEVYASTASGI